MHGFKGLKSPYVRLLWLGLLVLQQQHVLASAKVVCSLHVEGFGIKPGLKSAQLSCSGGTVKALIHPLLLAQLGSQSSIRGIQLSRDSECERFRSACLLTICEDTAVTFLRATVERVTIAVNTTQGLTGLICAVGHSSLVFDGARFTGNTARPLAVAGEHTNVVIKGSNFINNTAASSSILPERHGGAVYLDGGTAHIGASKFVGNSAAFGGGAIAILDARLEIDSSVLEGNSGVWPSLGQSASCTAWPIGIHNLTGVGSARQVGDRGRIRDGLF